MSDAQPTQPPSMEDQLKTLEQFDPTGEKFEEIVASMRKMGTDKLIFATSEDLAANDEKIKKAARKIGLASKDGELTVRGKEELAKDGTPEDRQLREKDEQLTEVQVGDSPEAKRRLAVSPVQSGNVGFTGNMDDFNTSEADREALKQQALNEMTNLNDKGDFRAAEDVKAALLSNASVVDLSRELEQLRQAKMFDDVKLRDGKEIIYDGEQTVVETSKESDPSLGGTMMAVGMTAAAASLLASMSTTPDPAEKTVSPAPEGLEPLEVIKGLAALKTIRDIEGMSGVSEAAEIPTASPSLPGAAGFARSLGVGGRS